MLLTFPVPAAPCRHILLFPTVSTRLKPPAALPLPFLLPPRIRRLFRRRAVAALSAWLQSWC
jgi:hypothetical protein